MQAAALRPVVAFARDAQEQHRAGRMVQYIAEILRRHQRAFQRLEAVRAEFAARNLAGEGKGARIVDGDGKARFDRDLRAQPVGGGDVGGQPLDRLRQAIPGLVRQCSQRAAHGAGIGDDIVGMPRLDPRDGDDNGFARVELACHHGLQRGHDLCRDGHRIGCAVRHGGMAPGTFHHDLQRV